MSEGGPYIVLEGIDGTGKSTQARLLTSWLRCHYSQVRRLKEPYDDFTPSFASSLTNADAKSLVYEADRLSKRHLLGQDWAIVQDRSFYSTIAYQNPSGPVREFILRDREYREPDLVIFMDAPAKALRSRLEARGALDEYERHIEVQEAVRERYKALDGVGCAWLTVDALQTVQEAHEKIIEGVEINFSLSDLAWC